MVTANKVVIGTWPISGDLGHVSLNEADSMLRHSYECGFRIFDTAPSYGDGFSEFALGKVFRNKSDVLFNTKVGNLPFEGKNFSLPALKKSFEQSLKRLQTDHINALFLHNPRNENDNYLELLDFLLDLKNRGRIRYACLSMARDIDYQQRYRLSQFDGLMHEANLFSMNWILTKPPTRFYAHSPLATGLLGGRITEQTVFSKDDQRSQWLHGARLSSLLRRVEVIKSYADAPLPSLARRFVLSHPNIDFVVFGVKTADQVDDICRDLADGPLDTTLLSRLTHEYVNDFGLIGERHLNYSPSPAP
jgi:aryl-alcohol dehydrogenase-like predicted oxidoreductase